MKRIALVVILALYFGCGDSSPSDVAVKIDGPYSVTDDAVALRIEVRSGNDGEDPSSWPVRSHSKVDVSVWPTEITIARSGSAAEWSVLVEALDADDQVVGEASGRGTFGDVKQLSLELKAVDGATASDPDGSASEAGEDGGAPSSADAGEDSRKIDAGHDDASVDDGGHVDASGLPECLTADRVFMGTVTATTFVLEGHSSLVSGDVTIDVANQSVTLTLDQDPSSGAIVSAMSLMDPVFELSSLTTGIRTSFSWPDADGGVASSGFITGTFGGSCKDDEHLQGTWSLTDKNVPSIFMASGTWNAQLAP